MRLAAAVLVVTASGQLAAASLVVEVRDTHGGPVADAVVYAVPQGRPAPPPARAAAVVDQKNRMFVPHVLPVQVGTAVSFPNSDNVRHQVYSFSPAKKFQLPLYAGNPAGPVVFDKPGVVSLGCNIHDRMSAYIVVVDTPYFATANDGHAELQSLPDGAYAVRVWYPGMRQEPPPQELALGSGAAKTIAFRIEGK